MTLRNCRFIETSLPEGNELPDDWLLLKVDRFAFTANNITYAVIGEQIEILVAVSGALGLWARFRCGVLPRCCNRRHADIAVGERLFGYLPMATHLVIEAAGAHPKGLRDGAAHRQEVSPVYNTYTRVSGDPAFAGRKGDEQALMRPLFMLSFLVDVISRRTNPSGPAA